MFLQLAAEPAAIRTVEFVEPQVNETVFHFAGDLLRRGRKPFRHRREPHFAILRVEEHPRNRFTFLGLKMSSLAERFTVSREHDPAGGAPAG